jgi:DNA invertase Pin-like site-specific DNA recombinase
MTTTLTVAWFLFVPIVILIGVLLWFSEDQPQRIRRWSQQGMSQRTIAARLGITRYQVRRTLSTC